jgi:hypothetical protein
MAHIWAVSSYISPKNNKTEPHLQAKQGASSKNILKKESCRQVYSHISHNFHGFVLPHSLPLQNF